MLEEYKIDDLYYGKIFACKPMCIENFGGCISMDYVDSYSYDAILYSDGIKYIDINHPKRIINVIECPQMDIPSVSDDNYLYELKVNTLDNFREHLGDDRKDCKVLKKGLFNEVKFY